MNARPRLRLLPPSQAYKVIFSTLIGRSSPVNCRTTAALPHHRAFIAVPHAASARLSYLYAGQSNGQPILFIHGTPGSAAGWDEFLVNGAPRYFHLAVDRPGFGESTSQHPVADLALQAQTISALLNKQNKWKTILVGHSLGASVALQIALDFPHLVSGLLLIAGAFDPQLEEVHILQPLAAFTPLSRLLPEAISIANRELLGLKKGLIEQTDRLDQITLPVSVIHGDADPLVPVENTAYLIGKLKSAAAEVTILKNKDHFIPWTAKPAIDTALKHLIETVQFFHRG